MTAKQKAKQVHESIELEFNPYATGSKDDAEYTDELLRLATESNNG